MSRCLEPFLRSCFISQNEHNYFDSISSYVIKLKACLIYYMINSINITQKCSGKSCQSDECCWPNFQIWMFSTGILISCSLWILSWNLVTNALFPFPRRKECAKINKVILDWSIVSFLEMEIRSNLFPNKGMIKAF